MSIKLLLSAALASAALTFAPTAWANGNDSYYDDDGDAYYDDYDDAYDDYYDDRFAEDAIVDPYPRDVIVRDVPDQVIVRTEILRRRHVPACGCAQSYDYPYYDYHYGPARRALRGYYRRPW